jgi:hypothetical protein
VKSGTVVRENYDTLNPNVQRPKSLRRIDYAFYFGSVPFNLQTWATFKVTHTSSLPAITVAGNVAAPVLGFQNKDGAGRKNNMVDVAAIMQVQVVYEEIVVAKLTA